MPKAHPIQNQFNAGEFSPLLYGRSDLEKYRAALKVCENFVPLIQGGVTRTPGTKFVAEVKYSDRATRLITFQFSTEQAYILEVGDRYIRFFTDHGAVVVSGVVAWADATAYVAGDVRAHGGVNYYCHTAHTSVAGAAGNEPGVGSTADDVWHALSADIFEIPTPYAADDVFGVMRTQSADVLYLTHPSYAPRKLVRRGATDWTLEEIEFVDGPYLRVNSTDTEMTVSAQNIAIESFSYDHGAGEVEITTPGAHLLDVGDSVTVLGNSFTYDNGGGCGAAVSSNLNGAYTVAEVVDTHSFVVAKTIAGWVGWCSQYVSKGEIQVANQWTVTLSATVGVNGGLGLQNTDVGRALRVQDGATWRWTEIQAVDSVTKARVGDTAPGYADLGAVAATKEWRLGAWSDTTGYPVAVTFYQDRLVFGGGGGDPRRLDGSVTADYELFQPSAPDGSVADDDAVSVTLGSNQVNSIRWLRDNEKGMLVGTSGSCWVVRPDTLGGALTPTNVTADKFTVSGAAPVDPIEAGRTILYVQNSARKLREAAYVFEVDGFTAPDMTLLAEHVTRGGIVEMAYQQEPYSVVWAVRADGTLLGFTYDREQDVLAWHRHPREGVSFKSVAVVPEPEGEYDELWLIGQYEIEGVTKQYVEYMMPFWEGGQPLADAFYVGCGLSYSGPGTTSLSGLDHLEGETVTVLADGAAHPDKVVSGGAITLDRTVQKAHVGLGYSSNMQSLGIEAGAADGTAQGKKKRIPYVTVRMFETLGLQVGPDANTLDTVSFRTSAHPMGAPPPAFTGDKQVGFPGGHDTEGTVYVRQPGALPANILALMPKVITQDG